MKHRFLYKFLTINCLIFAHFTILNAQDDVLSLISQDMNHFESVATITKQNEHYQPYIISVFKGKELEDLGVS
ncbi:hypothetical protein, partial [Sulfurimonas sp.]